MAKQMLRFSKWTLDDRSPGLVGRRIDQQDRIPQVLDEQRDARAAEDLIVSRTAFDR
ncbi:MAG: hypothetical protein QGG36_15635 [Pirellulaceae bacterium]|jgi:hypothetical protein|nr:hypothetical protein [Pirellulaceae bacterium]